VIFADVLFHTVNVYPHCVADRDFQGNLTKYCKTNYCYTMDQELKQQLAEILARLKRLETSPVTSAADNTRVGLDPVKYWLLNKLLADDATRRRREVRSLMAAR
jgi:hypothetical protein